MEQLCDFRHHPWQKTTRWKKCGEGQINHLRLLLALALASFSLPANALLVGPDDKPLVGVFHLHANHRGDTLIVTDRAGTAISATLYSPYGEPAVTAGASSPHAYAGQRHDHDTGLNYAHARYYDPALGRFLSVDPDFQRRSPYQYAGASPQTLVDPGGRGFETVLRQQTRSFMIERNVNKISDLTKDDLLLIASRVELNDQYSNDS